MIVQGSDDSDDSDETWIVIGCTIGAVGFILFAAIGLITYKKKSATGSGIA